MSAWRIIVKRLHAFGGAGRRTQFDHADANGMQALREAKRLGLVKSNGRQGRATIWTLTPLGRAYCEGLAEAKCGPVTRGKPKTIIAASWLASLPQGIRIEKVSA